MSTSRSVTVHLKGNISDYNQKMLAGAAVTKAFTSTLDTSTDRSTMLVQSLLAVGPALVPIGAAAIPAISGLTNQLAFAAVGAGVAALALSGVGGALDAVNKYSLEPTTENFAKMQETMATLGPAALDFVAYLRQIAPELKQLKDAAQDGLLPGAQQGIAELMALLPQAEQVVSNVATAIGDLIAEAGDNLNDPRWREFFVFLETEARPTLMTMGRTLGNFAEGFANLWMAFDPLSDNFSRSFLQMSRDFAEWTDGLSETQGFQEFVDYITRVGPKAWDTLGALGNALLQVVEAAAPVGEVVLPVIEALADGLATVADSELGPVIIGVVSLASALSRLKAVGTAANSSALGGLFGKTGYGGLGATLKTATDATNELRVAQQKLTASALTARDAQFALIPTGDKRKALAAYSSDLRAVAKAEAAAMAATRARRVQMGQTAAGVAGLAFVMSDLDDKMGLSNTAMFGMMGTMAGPWGAAIGVGVGLAMDFAASNDEVEQAVARAGAALSSSSASYQEQISAIDAAIAKIDEFKAEVDDVRLTSFASLKNSFEDAFGRSDVEEQADDKARLTEQRREAVRAAQEEKFAQHGVDEAMRNASDATREQTEAILNNIDAMNQKRDAALIAANAELTYEAAIDAAAEAARNGKNSLDANTEAGRTNLELLYNLAGGWNNLEPSMQRAEGASERAREEFIKSAMGMGATAAEAEKLADKYLEIPADVSTLFSAAGADGAIEIAARVAAQYEMTPEEIRTELKALDYASEDIDAVIALMEEYERQKPKPKVDAETEPAKKKINGIQKLLNGLRDKTIYIDTVHRTAYQRSRIPAGRYADGGEILGPGGPRDDLIPIMASNREFMVNAIDAQANLSLLHDINSGKFRYSKPQGYADGGQVLSRLAPMGSQPWSNSAASSVAPGAMFDAEAIGQVLSKAVEKGLTGATLRADSRGNMKLILSGA